MNIKDLHTTENPVSAIPIFKNGSSLSISIRILKGEVLKEHITKVPALLICFEGNALFENEDGLKENLLPGDYIHIQPFLKHWVKGIEDCQLLLLK